MISEYTLTFREFRRIIHRALVQRMYMPSKWLPDIYVQTIGSDKFEMIEKVKISWGSLEEDEDLESGET